MSLYRSLRIPWLCLSRRKPESVVPAQSVLFETNKFLLQPAARESLAKIAGIFLAYPDLRLEIDGHTDRVGSDAYNQQLSEKRAVSVRDYLA